MTVGLFCRAVKLDEGRSVQVVRTPGDETVGEHWHDEWAQRPPPGPAGSWGKDATRAPKEESVSPLGGSRQTGLRAQLVGAGFRSH